MTSLKAVILAGGFATRLRPLSCTRPKALFPIVNKPLLQWTLERLAKNNVDQIILAVNALTQFYIRQKHLPKSGLKIKYSIDPPKKPLGTAGPIKKAEKLIGHDQPFIVLNGDIFADIDYKELLKAHKKTEAIATIALCAVDDPSAFGVAELEDGNLIKRFIEKPAKNQAPSNFINAGAYVLDPAVFNYIAQGRPVSLEREVFPKLAQEGKLFGHKVCGLWIDIGKPQEYLEANKTILDLTSDTHKKPKSKTFEIRSPVALERSVKIGKGAVIGPYAIIGKNAKVGEGVKISNSVIFEDTEIGDKSVINGALIGERARIGSCVKIEKNCIVADQATIRDKVNLSHVASICPAREITETF